MADRGPRRSRGAQGAQGSQGPVSPSERDLILLARGLVGAHPAEVRALVQRPRALPPVISSAAAELLGDALSHVWPALWRRGGTRRSAPPVGEPAAERLSAAAIDATIDRPADRAEPGAATSSAEPAATGHRAGRFWEHHAPVGLTFSLATLQLLRWLLATRLVAPAGTPLELPIGGALTVGDQVMVYFALEAMDGTPAQATIAGQPLVRAAALAWLGFADVLGAGGAAVPGELASLCGGAGAIVVEALGGELARRWRAVELRKRAIAAPEVLIALGAAQDATLGGFLAACERHGRKDLAGFVIDAAAPLLRRDIAPLPHRLDPGATLGLRATARLAAGALLRAVMVWAAWDQAHRGVRFIDDDYPVAQRLLARFEPIAAAGRARAEAWLTELASLVARPAPFPVPGPVPGPVVD